MAGPTLPEALGAAPTLDGTRATAPANSPTRSTTRSALAPTRRHAQRRFQPPHRQGRATMSTMRLPSRSILGLALIVLSFVVAVPLHGLVGVVATWVISMAMWIAGFAVIFKSRPRFTRRYRDWGVVNRPGPGSGGRTPAQASRSRRLPRPPGHTSAPPLDPG